MQKMFVIEILLPDGYHWYAGIQKVTKDSYKGHAVITGHVWTKNLEYALRFPISEANDVADLLKKGNPELIVIAEEAAHFIKK